MKDYDREKVIQSAVAHLSMTTIHSREDINRVTAELVQDGLPKLIETASRLNLTVGATLQSVFRALGGNYTVPADTAKRVATQVDCSIESTRFSVMFGGSTIWMRTAFRGHYATTDDYDRRVSELSVLMDGVASSYDEKFSV